MGYSWQDFLPSEVYEKEKTKDSVNKEEYDTVSTEKEDVKENDIAEDVKENDIANSEKLFENLISHISVEHNFTRLVLIL